jgi:hypothetical protein
VSFSQLFGPLFAPFASFFGAFLGTFLALVNNAYLCARDALIFL